MTPTKLRVALIGAGSISAAHVKGALLHADKLEYVALCDVSVANLQKRKEQLGSEPALFTDWRTLYAEFGDRFDAVDICLPHHLHAEAIIAAADAGLAVLCEKPLCTTMAEAAEIAAAAERTGVTIMCAHNQLFFPAVAEAKRLIDEGELGTVFEVRTTDSFRNDFTPETMGWRAHAATAGGGELIDTGYHPVYLLQHLAGSVPVEVAAMLSQHRLSFMEGEDSAQVLVRYANDVVGVVTTSWAYEAAPGTEKFSVVAERGSMSSDGTTLVVKRLGEEPQTLAFEPVHDIAAEIRHFAECLLTGARPIHTYVEGIDVLGVILAAYASQETHAFAPVKRLTEGALV